MAKRGKVKGVASEGRDGRPVRIRKYQYLFLIVCEDQKTEPAYFEKFRAQIPPQTIYLKPVGTGRSAKGVVEQALRERALLEQEAGKEVDEVWVVFDKDDADRNEATVQNFQDAFEIAGRERIEIAYSNEAFELWLLLHLTDVAADQPMARSLIYEKLQAQIRKTTKFADFEYDHKHPDSKTVDMILEIGNQALAIQRAEKLLAHHGKAAPIQANPSTKVHHLVRTLLGWIAYFSYDSGSN
jgi:RloB-like protein